MDNFQIETAQNVSIAQNVAGIGERLLGYLVDMLILGTYWIATLFALAAYGTETSDNSSLAVYFMILGVPTFLYFLLFETLWDGRSPGKAALKLRVVKLDGSKPGFGSYFVRWIMRIIDITLTSGGVAVFTILINGKGQRLGDIAAGTTVVNENKKVTLNHTLLVELPENYQPKYPQVTVFSDADMQKVKSLYEQARRHGNHNVIIKLYQRLITKMQVKPEENPMDFIERVIWDFNYYTQQ